ncbi:unnamed protein product, partial [Hymenolepis diminuta]
MPYVLIISPLLLKWHLIYGRAYNIGLTFLVVSVQIFNAYTRAHNKKANRKGYLKMD